MQFAVSRVRRRSNAFRLMRQFSLVEVAMLGWALTFLVIGVIAAVLGFTTIAGASFAIAKFLAAVFLILFLVFVILGVTAVRRITS